MRTEKAMLAKVAALASVTKYVDTSSDNTALLLKPVAAPFAIQSTDYVKKVAATGYAHIFVNLVRRHFVELLDILKAAHALHIIHRDITLHNMFACSDGSLLLNDWGCAVDISVTPEVPFSGALRLAPDSVLTNIITRNGIFYKTCLLLSTRIWQLCMLRLPVMI